MDLKSPKECQFGFLRAQFDTEYKSKYFDADLFFYSGKTISHYTDLGGLFGIVESGGFWLSDHRFLNDSEEFENGRKLTMAILENLSEKTCHQDFSDVLKATNKYLSKYREKACYVCSFSKDPDCLDQWRSYAKNGKGISITFDNPQKSLSHFFMMPIMSISKVIYSDQEKSKRLIATIEKYESEHKTDKQHGNPINTDDWASEMAKNLSLEFMNFKNAAFESEKEVRLVVSSSHLNHFKGLKFRVSDDRIIPYLDSSDLYNNDGFKNIIKEELLPIIKIHVGPTANQEIMIKSIEEYIKARGYTNVKVVKSKVPYRG